MTKSLAALAQSIGIVASSEVQVTRLTSDSREIVPGALFVAVRGTSADGHAFVAGAQAQGAVAVVGEDEPEKHAIGIPYLQVADARLALSRLAAEFHDNPTRAMRVIGVTGTSGKTTTTYLIESILRAAGGKVAVIGTVNYRFENRVLPSSHTTPGPVELQRFFAEVRDLGCTDVVMEVSSHALKQRRAAGVLFDGMLFTNLSPEHLDYHPDLEDYYRAKELLFTELAEAARDGGKEPVAVANEDDDFGRRLFKERLQGSLLFSRVAAFPPGHTLRTQLSGIRGQYYGIEIRSELTGLFNASNILGAVALCECLGVPKDKIEQGVRDLKAVPGRLERVPHPEIHVLVDYAHKPDALEKMLRTLASFRANGSRLITVVGCGGDRDRTKRPVMGRIAVELSDRVFITSDNPRTEDPAAIIAEIVAGTKGFANFAVDADRARAIHAAVAEARPGDVVVIAGKGHEDYQIIGTAKTHFDDREVAAEALSRR
jgi:UDP-N-acetylmuramoyl-L-alanyl-D-glutamate--2,6-diaminopimelate ligase